MNKQNIKKTDSLSQKIKNDLIKPAGLPHWIPATTALRADEYMYRDVPKHILNAKKCIKKMVGRK